MTQNKKSHMWNIQNIILNMGRVKNTLKARVSNIIYTVVPTY